MNHQHTDDELVTLHSQMRVCRRCLDAGHPIAPGAVFSGPTTACVMIVGQAPGVTEMEVKRPFNGSSGRRLFRWLAQAGWDENEFRATQYMTAVTKCYPGKSPGGKGDRVPTRAEQKLCTPFLERELALVRPQILVPVGGLAIRRFLGSVKLVDVVGEIMQDEAGCWIVPLPHPSGASLWLNRPENQERVTRALARLQDVMRETCDAG
ncbi:MAG: uracil-DNA glycosylase [Chloroflexi bacterium]|nr:uracil-DNA glycosylase [Chloroflexota bacterium]